jgi:hypothetical protein
MISRTGRLLKIVVLVVLLVQPVFAGNGENNSCFTEHLYAVRIADIKHFLLFESDDLSIEVKEAVVGDIERVFSSIEEVTIKDRVFREWPILTKKYHLTRYTLHFPKYKTWLPEVLKSYLGHGIKFGERYFLFISDRVVQKYQEALKLKAKHPEKLRKAYEFVELLNDKERLREVAGNVKDAQKLFSFHGMEPWDSYETYMKKLGLDSNISRIICQPSLLDFHIIKDQIKEKKLSKELIKFLDLSEIKDSLAFSSMVKIEQKSGSRESLSRWSFIYRDGEWRKSIAPPIE